MDIEESLEECRMSLSNIMKYNPEPFYVDEFFLEFLESVKNVINGIVREAERDFGLFINKKINLESFREKAELKNDLKALEFHDWLESRIIKENQFNMARFIWDCLKLTENKGIIPSSKIFLKPKEPIDEDVVYPLNILMKNGKILSKDELEISKKHNLNLFTKIINERRKLNSNEKISEKEVEVSALIDFDGEYFEILECCKIYLNILKEIVDEARNRIKQLTSIN